MDKNKIWESVEEGDIILHILFETQGPYILFETQGPFYKFIFIRQTKASIWVREVYDNGHFGRLQQLRKESNAFFGSVIECYDYVIEKLTHNAARFERRMNIVEEEIAKYRKIRDSKTPTGQTKETEKK